MILKEGFVYPATAVFGWWYTGGLREFSTIIFNFVLSVLHFFSIPYLLRTLFAPWRRDVIEVVNAPLQVILEVFLLNLVSRAVGAAVRAATIAAGLVILVFSALGGLGLLLLWLFWPLLVAGEVIWGVILLLGG